MNRMSHDPGVAAEGRMARAKSCVNKPAAWKQGVLETSMDCRTAAGSVSHAGHAEVASGRR
jgi:hypothetical protein